MVVGGADACRLHGGCGLERRLLLGFGCGDGEEHSLFHLAVGNLGIGPDEVLHGDAMIECDTIGRISLFHLVDMLKGFYRLLGADGGRKEPEE